MGRQNDVAGNASRNPHSTPIPFRTAALPGLADVRVAIRSQAFARLAIHFRPSRGSEFRALWHETDA